VPGVTSRPGRPVETRWRDRGSWLRLRDLLPSPAGPTNLAARGGAYATPDLPRVATRNYVFQLDATTWGWIHLLVGLLVAFAGYGLLSGKTWARVVAITLAVLSAVANFLFIPYYPFWSLLIITLDVFVIWASAPMGESCATPGSERRGPAPRWRRATGRPRPGARAGGRGGR
jgi:hypothetical protein